MDAREQRGLVIAALCKLNRTGAVWSVPSQSDGSKSYTVDPGKKTCSCPDHKETGFTCKHLYAVEFVIQRELFADGTVTETKSITFREEVKYTQNWPVYNRAQMEEKHRLQVLLVDLCKQFPEPVQVSGRKRIALADRLFAVVYKVYCGMSSRRNTCDMNDAAEEGHLSRKLHPSRVVSFLEEEELTPLLHEMVKRSALPLKAIETEFAVDSSGFSVSRHVRWKDEKYGVEKSGRDWVKVHLCTGVKTNCVTAAEIKDRDSADSPQFPGLVKATAANFKIGEVSADKAYLGVDNVECVHHTGGTPFIAPKSNTTGGVGGLFEKMFHFFQFNREEFMDRYHKRSNVESTFSAIKAKFGDNVRSKTDVAMRNEVLCKLICHNLCCVIMAQIELGIEATFWGESKDECRAVLPMVRRN
jgi:transposase